MAAEVTHYWFQGQDPAQKGFQPCVQRWYFGGKEADAEIAQKFGATLEDIIRKPADPAWEASVDLIIAKVIMLDQVGLELLP